jgi:hypothetical protein
MIAVEQDMNSSRFFKSGALGALAALSLSFQIPAAKIFIAAVFAHEKSKGWNAPLSLNRRYSFSYSYQRPSSKQGVSEERTSMSSERFDRRYAKLKSMGAAYRQYNLWWSELEDSGQAGSSSPISCLPAYQLSPATESERVALGFHHYHCVKQSTLARFDNLFRRDQNAGMQSGVVLWSSPPVYRYTGCLGMASEHGVVKDGCVPRDDAIGGPAAQGQFVGRYPASTGSEIAVDHNCGATGTAYRFQIPLTKDVSSAYGGEPVYIYGVSSLGLATTCWRTEGNSESRRQ